MSKKLSGWDNKKRTKAREKQAAQSSSLMSSWLGTKSKGEGAELEVISHEPQEQIQDLRENSSGIPELTSSAEVEFAITQQKSEPTQPQDIHHDEVPDLTATRDLDAKIPHDVQPQQQTTSEFEIEEQWMEDEVGTTSNGKNSEDNYFSLSHNSEFSAYDPGTWPETLSDTQKSFIVKTLTENPMVEYNLANSNRNGRLLTKDWFYKQLPCGSKIKRTWLLYSEIKNVLFCLPCKMFSKNFSDKNLSSLAKAIGFSKWKKLSDRIPEHEKSLSHKKCFCTWKTFECTLTQRTGIDRELQNQIEEEENHWKSVLRVIVDVIMHLAKQGSPLRGSQENLELSDPRCGKFLNTIELISHYQPVLKEHINRHKKGQITYFSSNVQNEFLEIIACKVKEQIINDIKKAKYFSMMFDSTPDISHLEQMSQVIRYVKIDEDGFEIVESFIGFFNVGQKIGEALTEAILQKVKDDGLDINNCRGQSYDSGSNMAAKYKGVQSRVLQENSLAFFVPCSAHSLNLVGNNAANVSTDAEIYFGTVNCLYKYFSSSTTRWKVLKKHVPLSLKLQSETRWSSKREAILVIYKHLKQITEALEELSHCPTATAVTKAEAISLQKNIKTVNFIAMTCFWFKVLIKIDTVNKIFQQKDMTIDQSAHHIDGLIKHLDSRRSAISNESVVEAKENAKCLGIEPTFKESRQRKRKRCYDELCEDESGGISAEQKFKLLTLEVIDRILTELKTRFHANERLSDLFAFLNGKSFHTGSIDLLQSQATKLASTYKSDVDKTELLLLEVESFKFHALELDPAIKQQTLSRELFETIYRYRLQDAYPNITTCLRIFLTLPVSVASNERSFSKLKLIKTYVRNLTTEKRLNNLSIINIEHQIANKMSYDNIIASFSAKKSRKVKF